MSMQRYSAPFLDAFGNSFMATLTRDSGGDYVRYDCAELTRLRADSAALATLEAWLRDGHDKSGNDRWLHTPNGADGPVIARSYRIEDIEAPSLLALAAQLKERG